jgi:BT1 family
MQAPGRVLWFFAIVYAVEGIGQAKYGLLGQPITWFLKEVAGWDAMRVSASLAALDVPWIIKPLWGALSDFVPLFGLRRRSWLVVANVLGIVAFAWVAVFAGGHGMIAALVVTSVAMALSSTVCGALLVETSHASGNSALLVNQQWLWFNVAQMLAFLTAGWLIQTLPAEAALRAAAAISAVAPVAIIFGVRLIGEDRAVIDLAALRGRFGALGAALRQRDVWLVIGFLFLYYFSPGLGTPLYYEMTDHLHFSQAFIGVLSAVSAGGWVLGGVAHRVWLRRLPPRLLLRLSILGGTISALSYLMMDGPVSAAVVWVGYGFASMIAFIATLSLAAEACPEGVEGFAFAAMMSILNVATPLADVIGSGLYEHAFGHRLAPLIVVSAAATAAMALLVPFVPARKTV